MIDIKIFGTVFFSVLVAELGDKTQLATMLFAADRDASKWTVFFGSAMALVVSSAIGVLVGGALSYYVSGRSLHLVAGAGFVIIGIWTLSKAF